MDTGVSAPWAGVDTPVSAPRSGAARSALLPAQREKKWRFWRGANSKKCANMALQVQHCANTHRPTDRHPRKKNYDFKRVFSPRVNARGAASGAEVFFWRGGGALLGVRTGLFRPRGAHPCTRVSEGGGDAPLGALVLPPAHCCACAASSRSWPTNWHAHSPWLLKVCRVSAPRTVWVMPLTPIVPAPGPLASAPKMSNKKLEEKYDAPESPCLNPSHVPNPPARIQPYLNFTLAPNSACPSLTSAPPPSSKHQRQPTLAVPT